MSATRSEAVLLIAQCGNDNQAWSPDGQWLTFNACKQVSDAEKCALYFVRSEGRALAQIGDYEFYYHFAGWRP
jgi:Tol biopolymer transport system component